MTIARVCGSIENTTVRKFDRGGKSMNMIIKLLTGLKCKDRENRDLNDCGYTLYQSLEYNLKYLKGAYTGTSGRRFRKHPDTKPEVSGHFAG